MENITNKDTSEKWGTNKKNKPLEARFKLSITFRNGVRPTCAYYSYDYIKLTKEGKKYRLYNESIGFDKLKALLEKLPPWKWSKASLFFAEDGKKKTDGSGNHEHWLGNYYPDGHKVGRRGGKPLIPIFENGILNITKTLAPLQNLQGVLIP